MRPDTAAALLVAAGDNPERLHSEVAGTRTPPRQRFQSIALPVSAAKSVEDIAMDEGRPISYMALEVGTPVLSASGTEFGTVEHVLQIPELDLFDGIAVTTKHGLRFVDRDQISGITTATVRCKLTETQVASLPAPHGTPVLRPDPGHDEGRSLTAWYGRTFGRERWKSVD